MRTLPLVLFALAAQTMAQVQPASKPESAAPEKQVALTPPPGPATTQEKSLLAKAKESLEAPEADVSAILTNPAFTPVRARTEFRELIKAHAAPKPLTICGPEEPGTRLHVTFEFVDAAGRPVAGALLYLYHTSAKGWYSDKAAHIQASSGDYRHARLFGYAITDANGRIDVRTIRPASYPNTDLPQHLHLHLSVGGKEVLASELLFEDDPMLSREKLEAAEHGGYVAAKVEKAADGVHKCKATFTVKG